MPGTTDGPLWLDRATLRAMDTSDDPPFADALLLALVRSAERSEDGTALALTTPAGVISGRLVGREGFLDRLRGSGVDDETYQDLRALWVLPVAPSAPGSEDGQEGQEVTGRYMHLVDVTVVTGFRQTQMPLLRLRSDTVSGWTFGALNSD